MLCTACVWRVSNAFKSVVLFTVAEITELLGTARGVAVSLSLRTERQYDGRDGVMAEVLRTARVSRVRCNQSSRRRARC